MVGKNPESFLASDLIYKLELGQAGQRTTRTPHFPFLQGSSPTDKRGGWEGGGGGGEDNYTVILGQEGLLVSVQSPSLLFVLFLTLSQENSNPDLWSSKPLPFSVSKRLSLRTVTTTLPSS